MTDDLTPGDARAPEAPRREHPDDDRPAVPVMPAPGAGTLALLATAWLLATVSSARQFIGDTPDGSVQSVTRAALEFPQVVAAALIAGAAVGLAAGNVLLGRRSNARALTRWVTGATAGLAAGLLVAVPVLLAYDRLPSVVTLSVAIAGTAALGGLLAGGRRRAVIGAGVTGALAVFVVQFLVGLFSGDLRTLFGAGGSPESVLVASGWLVMVASLVAGLAAGVLSYAYLRRGGPPGLRWPAYLLAGALPGLLGLLAEAIARLAGARLFQLVGEVSPDGQALERYLAGTRFNQALIVLFVAALVAVILFGRTLGPAEHALDPEPTREQDLIREPEPTREQELVDGPGAGADAAPEPRDEPAPGRADQPGN